MTTPKLFGANGLLLDKSQEYKETIANELFRLLSVCKNPVISRTQTTPPTATSISDFYIVPAGATGAWAGKTNQIAYPVVGLNGQPITGAWSFWVPSEGMVVYLLGGSPLAFDGTQWQTAPGGGDMLESEYGGSAPGVVALADESLSADEAGAIAGNPANNTVYGKQNGNKGFFDILSYLLTGYTEWTGTVRAIAATDTVMDAIRLIQKQLSGEWIVSRLQALTGEAKLDASAIKNLPTGGGGSTLFVSAEITIDTSSIPVENIPFDSVGGNDLFFLAGKGFSANGSWSNPFTNGQITATSNVNMIAPLINLVNRVFTQGTAQNGDSIYNFNLTPSGKIFSCNKIGFSAGAGIPTIYLEFSLNGTDWTSAATINTSNWNVDSYYSYDVPQTLFTEYWRIRNVGNSTLNGIQELQLWGKVSSIAQKDLINGVASLGTLNVSWLGKIAFSGSVSVLSIPDTSDFVNGWWCYIRNDKTSALTISPSNNSISVVSPTGLSLDSNELGFLRYDGNQRWHFYKIG